MYVENSSMKLLSLLSLYSDSDYYSCVYVLYFWGIEFTAAEGNQLSLAGDLSVGHFCGSLQDKYFD